MDFLVKHWGAFPRQFPSRFPLLSMDFLKEKTSWVRHTFQSCNISILLRGGGIYRLGGREWTVDAPCVLTQWPGKPVEYGPCGVYDSWDECYGIFSPRALRDLRACGYFDDDRPVWPIPDMAAIEALIAELHGLAHSAQPHAMADRMDRVWDRLILESLLDRPSGANDAVRIHDIVSAMHREPGREFDFDAIARRLGMAPATFRRKWIQSVGTPPARYLQDVRIRAACRLLAETRDPVKTIAHTVGYPDELHFSRRFRANQSVAPREYRRIFAINPAQGA